MNQVPQDILDSVEQRIDSLRALHHRFATELSNLEDSMLTLQESLTGRSSSCDPLPWRVTENGIARLVNAQEMQTIAETSSADLLFMGHEQRLRFVGRDGGAISAPAWASLSLSLSRILHLGLTNPGGPFGNKSYNRLTLAVSIKPATLSRYIYQLTSLIQGKGTDGPYLYRVSHVPHVSSTSFGYRFDDRWRYILIEPEDSTL